MAKRTLTNMSTNDLHAELQRRERGAQRLATKREKLLAQVAEIDAELASYGYEAVGGKAPPAAGVGVRNSMNLVDALSTVLKNKTMVSEAAEAVEKIGYRSSSANFRNIVNQTLLKHKGNFKKVGRGQYTAK